MRAGRRSLWLRKPGRLRHQEGRNRKSGTQGTRSKLAARHVKISGMFGWLFRCG
jgi:hypothetical protein